MINEKLLTIAEFASFASVSKQAIYKQVNNNKSQIAPYVIREGNKILIKSSALRELYGVDIKISTVSTENEPQEVEMSTNEQPTINPNNQPDNPDLNPNNQPISTDYIEFLKGQIEELKAEKKEVELRLNSIIQEKDEVIKEQSAQLAQLAQQAAEIATNAIKTTSQQQYLTATAAIQEQSEVEQETKKKSFWGKIFK